MSKQKQVQKNVFDISLPIPKGFSLSNPQPTQPMGPDLQKQIVRQAIKAAYHISDWAAKQDDVFTPAKQLASNDEINMVTALMQSLQPTNAVEAALAIQFTSTYIQGIKELQGGNTRFAMPLLTFSQTTLESIYRYRNKGMQQINVQYNVNQGQVVNIKNLKANSKKQGEQGEEV
jgi:hypothetical protein